MSHQNQYWFVDVAQVNTPDLVSTPWPGVHRHYQIPVEGKTTFCSHLK